MTSDQGIFITFEGGEGTGKSTQLRLLEQWLTARGKDIVATKEPGGTPIGQELRRMLVCGDKDKFDAVTEALLYYADRRIHLTQKIWPALEAGKWVLSDRFADSTVAYQYYGYDKRVSMKTLTDLYQMTVGDFKPDLTILLDIDPTIGLERSIQKATGMQLHETRHESRGLGFHNLMRNGFLEMAANEPHRFVVLNADKTVEQLHQEITALISTRFGIK